MNGYNFTERVRKVLQMAREEAQRLHHEYVGTEHILLGLIREGEGVAAAVLQNLSVDLDDTDTRKRLRNCASDAKKDFFVADDGSAVSAAFEQIKTQITARVYISK